MASNVFSEQNLNRDALPQLAEVYDRVYHYLIFNSSHRDTILQILGQIIVARDQSHEVDVFGSPRNSSSPKRIERILGLKHGDVMRILKDVQYLLELEGRDIKIRHSSFVTFLQERSRSRELYVDIRGAQFTLQVAAPIRRIFDLEGTRNSSTSTTHA